MKVPLLPRRRDLIAGLAAGLAAPAVLKAQPVFNDPVFQLGVASGDPAPDGFVIWTRLAPRPLEPHAGMPMAPVTVGWQVGTDDRLRTVVASGEAVARAELGHSVHVEVGGLQPGRPYWYRFTAGRDRSLIGRARTMPHPGATLDKLRFIAAGCQSYEDGLYTAYRHLAREEEIEFLWHYGDYIYENRWRPAIADPQGLPVPLVRRHAGDEPFSLDDYRARYSQYKLDLDLQAAHAAHTWWVTPDDHEVVNNWAGDHDETGAAPDEFHLRRQAAYQAYWENMPLRRSALPHGAAMQIYRRAAYGDLLSAHFLDTRQFRSVQPCGDGFKVACPAQADPAATLFGPEQERWLFDGLTRSPCRWNLMAQQVMVMPMDRRRGDDGETGPTSNMDSWGGYPAARQRLLDHLKRGKLTNVVIGSGDEHQHFAGELRAGGMEGEALATEFVATSIASGGTGQDKRSYHDMMMANNPHCRLMNNQRGYLVCEVGRDTWLSGMRVVDQVDRPGGLVSTRARFAVERGQPGLKPA